MSLLKKANINSTAWMTTLMMSIVGIIFGLYVYTEKSIDLANRQRQAGFQVVAQLRQSSDDLTQMVRLYIITGNPRYKHYYQDILDIRNGKMARPESYTYSYWDLVIAGDLAPPPENGKGIPLANVIQQSGFTENEISHLLAAKNNSDALTTIEFEAMKLVKAVGPDTATQQAEARQLLFSDRYYQAKSKIMQPINRFYHLMDQRTLSTINHAIVMAQLFRLIFIVSALFAIGLIWRSYATLKKLLGATAQDLHQLITRISAGDLSTITPVTSDMTNSVMAGLLNMQATLLANERERTHAAQILQKKFSTSASPV